MSTPLARLRQALAMVQAGRNRDALAVVDEVLAGHGAALAPAPEGTLPLPDGILPWLNLARTALAGGEAAVPPFLALQTAIVLLEV